MLAYTHALTLDIKGGLAPAFDAVGKARANIGLADRGSRADAGVLRLALQVGDDEICFPGQRIRSVNHCSRTVSQQEAAALATCLGNTIRPGMQQKRAGTDAVELPMHNGRLAAARRSRKSLRQLPLICGAR